MIRFELSVFSVLIAGYAFWVLGMFLVALRRASACRARDRVSEQLQPRIREALVDYLAGGGNRDAIRRLIEQDRSEFGDGLFAFQSSIAGDARDRLCDLALELALVHDWIQETRSKDLIRRRIAFERLSFVCSYEPCRRLVGDPLKQALHDDDAEVRVSAALALLQSGAPDEVEKVFELALSGAAPRILLTEDLRHHAGILCHRAIPAVLASDDSAAILATLEILTAWERALPLDLAPVLDHPDREIRLRALRLAPLTQATAATQSAVLDALGMDDVEFVVAGCQSAGRLRIEAAIRALARCLLSDVPEVARAAAEALAALPAPARATLREVAANGSPAGATAAREALAHGRGKGVA